MLKSFVKFSRTCIIIIDFISHDSQRVNFSLGQIVPGVEESHLKILVDQATEEKLYFVESLVHGCTSSRAIPINLLTLLKQNKVLLMRKDRILDSVLLKKIKKPLSSLFKNVRTYAMLFNTRKQQMLISRFPCDQDIDGEIYSP